MEHRSEKCVEAKITPRTRAIIPVDLFGQVAKLEAINRIAAAHGLAVVEDAAQAIGAKRHQKPACSTVAVGCLSFYPTKNLGAAGDAGRDLHTNDDKLAETCRLLRRTRFRPPVSPYVDRRDVARPGGGAGGGAGRQAALIWMPGMRGRRGAMPRCMINCWMKAPVVTPSIDSGNWSIYNQYVVRVPHRDDVRRKLMEGGIGHRCVLSDPAAFTGMLRVSRRPRGGLPGKREGLPGGAWRLPIYPELPEEHVRYVAKELLAAVRG